MKRTGLLDIAASSAQTPLTAPDHGHTTPRLSVRPRGKLSQLEAVRGFAALYVFIDHCMFDRFFDKASFGTASYLFRFSQEVVMAFFLISGFVIFYSVESKLGMRFAAYARARILRIVPILLLALLVSICLRGNSSVIHAPADRFQWLGALLFLADEPTLKPGVWFSPFCGNNPLWTLTYEWWFYFLFWPIYCYVPDRLQLRLVLTLALSGLVSYVFVPNQVSLVLSYFPIWWTGVELAKCYLRGKMKCASAIRRLLGMLAVMVLGRVALLPFSSRADIHRGFGFDPLLELRHVLAALAVVVLALLWYRLNWRAFRWLIGPFEIAAPISYSLYILHYPIVINAHFLAWTGRRSVEYTGYVVIALLLACWAEIWFQPRAARLVGRIWPAPARGPLPSSAVKA